MNADCQKDSGKDQFTMFTKLETKILNCLLSICSNTVVLPFTWNEGKMVITSKKYSSLYNCITWNLLLFKIGYQLVAIPLVTRPIDVNKLVLHMLFLVITASHLIFKLSMKIHKRELVQLYNEVTVMNSSWGKFILV